MKKGVLGHAGEGGDHSLERWRPSHKPPAGTQGPALGVSGLHVLKGGDEDGVCPQGWGLQPC